MISMSRPLVGIIMGSQSDWPTMEPAAAFLKQMEVPHEVEVVSAHRTPHRMVEYSGDAAGRGIRVIIAGAGGAAHLPGMVASLTDLPVIGVPVKSKALSGVDSLHSIVQMPPGIPVAAMAIGGAQNAAILACRILALSDDVLAERVAQFSEGLKEKVARMNDEVRQHWPED